MKKKKNLVNNAVKTVAVKKGVEKGLSLIQNELPRLTDVCVLHKKESFVKRNRIVLVAGGLTLISAIIVAGGNYISTHKNCNCNNKDCKCNTLIKKCTCDQQNDHFENMNMKNVTNKESEDFINNVKKS